MGVGKKREAPAGPRSRGREEEAHSEGPSGPKISSLFFCGFYNGFLLVWKSWKSWVSFPVLLWLVKPLKENRRDLVVNASSCDGEVG